MWSSSCSPCVTFDLLPDLSCVRRHGAFRHHNITEAGGRDTLRTRKVPSPPRFGTKPWGEVLPAGNTVLSQVQSNFASFVPQQKQFVLNRDQPSTAPGFKRLVELITGEPGDDSLEVPDSPLWCDQYGTAAACYLGLGTVHSHSVV